MSRIHAPAGRMSALTARLASPYFRSIDPSESSVRPVTGPALQNPNTSAPRTNREHSDAAIRTRRIFW